MKITEEMVKNFFNFDQVEVMKIVSQVGNAALVLLRCIGLEEPYATQSVIELDGKLYGGSDQYLFDEKELKARLKDKPLSYPRDSYSACAVDLFGVEMAVCFYDSKAKMFKKVNFEPVSEKDGKTIVAVHGMNEPQFGVVHNANSPIKYSQTIDLYKMGDDGEPVCFRKSYPYFLMFRD